MSKSHPTDEQPRRSLPPRLRSRFGKKYDLTANELRTLLYYDPEVGVFTRRTSNKRGQNEGDIAGGIAANGYWVIRLGKHLYQAHRLAWLYVHGQWPLCDIDHRNGHRSDNRITNLRDVSNSENCQNARVPRKHNKSGFLGVHLHGEKWLACISIEGRSTHLGLFETPEAAHTAYVTAKRRHHEGCTI